MQDNYNPVVFHEGKKRFPRVWLVIIIAFSLLLASGAGWFFFIRQDLQGQSASTLPVQQEPPEPRPVEVQGRYLFNGTVVLARRLEQAAGNDLTQPFTKMSTFKPSQYDAMAVDWECPSTDDVIPYQTQVSRLLFNCHVKWLPEFSKYFTIASLANNHSSDLGAEAFKKTQENLAKAGMQTYGHYEPSVKEDACEVIALPVRLQLSDDTEQKGTLPMAFCAWHYFYRTPGTGEMEVMERFAKIMPVFGFMHAGAEYFAKADAAQVSIGRKIIDLGAEFAIGNSPHWVQNGEVYKGKPIFYSTGNFMFDQIDTETMRGMSVDVTIKIKYDDNVAKWLALGKSCLPRNDTCLQTAEKQGLKKFDLDFVYNVVGSSGGANRITTRADETLQKAVEQRVGWDAMKKALGQQ